MPDIAQELTIEATPEKVFNALTQQDELAQWWTNHVTAEPKVGSIAKFSFDNGAVVFQMEIAELNAGKRVHWIVRHGPPHWEGTDVTWDLSPVESGTKLLFGHHGFAVADASYEETAQGWQYFLGSLKSYLETGKGTPHTY
jgi:uncharacterized protein YndB with AHSA1/START domain